MGVKIIFQTIDYFERCFNLDHIFVYYRIIVASCLITPLMRIGRWVIKKVLLMRTNLWKLN